MAKMRQESIDMFTEGGAQDRADAERAELAVIERWLPKLADEEQTRIWVQEAIALVGGDNMGKVMGALMKEHDAAFVSAEEEDYFRELLQSRAVGPPQWTETMELQFRQQLPLNMPSLASDAVVARVCVTNASGTEDARAGHSCPSSFDQS